MPRVRYWQVWNEPNITLYLKPQLATAARRRRLVPRDGERVRDPVKTVHADNVVVAGGLAPFFDSTPSGRAGQRLGSACRSCADSSASHGR